MKNLRLSSLAVLSCSVAVAGCRHAPSGPMSMPLRSTASAEDLRVFPASGIELLKLHAIAVPAFTDARDRRDAVGANVDNGAPVPVSTPDDVPAFLTERFVETLRANGASVAPSGAERIIRAEVQRYFVSETGVYDGNVALGFTVTDANGKVLWHAVAEGKSKRFGRSFAPENYQESLTSSFLEALKNLGEKPDFFQALK